MEDSDGGFTRAAVQMLESMSEPLGQYTVRPLGMGSDHPLSVKYELRRGRGPAGTFGFLRAVGTPVLVPMPIEFLEWINALMMDDQQRIDGALTLIEATRLHDVELMGRLRALLDQAADGYADG